MLTSAALNIHAYMERSFLNEGAVIGPDPGVRFNYRIGAFLKSYTQWYPWRDGLYYLQCQGYWVTANWMLSQDNDDRYAQLALAATDQVARRQREDGGWDYPNPEWRGRVATVEGSWASFALLESYRRTGRDEYLQRALKWHDFFSNKIGYQNYQGMTAVNYFMGRPGNPVPNNSALALRYLANLADATGDDSYLDKCAPMIDFLRQVQMPSGEFPYVVDDPGMLHFQCFQYHAFIYLDIWNYFVLTGDEQVTPILRGVLRFLEGSLSPAGFGFYQCDQKYRTVHYHTAAIAAALYASGNIGLDEVTVTAYRQMSQRAFQFLIKQQVADGSIPHSRGDYHLLCDHRRYPRYLAMMLFHLLSVNRQHASGLVTAGETLAEGV